MASRQRSSMRHVQLGCAGLSRLKPSSLSRLARIRPRLADRATACLTMQSSISASHCGARIGKRRSHSCLMTFSTGKHSGVTDRASVAMRESCRRFLSTAGQLWSGLSGGAPSAAGAMIRRDTLAVLDCGIRALCRLKVSRRHRHQCLAAVGAWAATTLGRHEGSPTSVARGLVLSNDCKQPAAGMRSCAISTVPATQ